MYLNAWFDLDNERVRPEPIRRSFVFQYADDYDLDTEQTEDLWYYISRMDIAFREWWIKKQPKRGKSGADARTVREKDA